MLHAATDSNTLWKRPLYCPCILWVLHVKFLLQFVFKWYGLQQLDKIVPCHIKVSYCVLDKKAVVCSNGWSVWSFACLLTSLGWLYAFKLCISLLVCFACHEDTFPSTNSRELTWWLRQTNFIFFIVVLSSSSLKPFLQVYSLGIEVLGWYIVIEFLNQFIIYHGLIDQFLILL